MLYLYILLFFICGGLAAGIANARSASWVAGFWSGMILGPVGIVVSFFLRDDHLAVQREVQSGSGKICPDCAELVKQAATKCRFCGHTFDGNEEAPIIPKPKPEDAMQMGEALTIGFIMFAGMGLVLKLALAAMN